MAVVLDYGNAYRDQRSMHPLFQMALDKPQGAPALSNVSPTEMKGTLDVGSEDSSKGAAENTQPVDGVIQNNGSWRRARQGAGSASTDMDDERLTREPSEADMDPNYERRKRRKTSPSVLSMSDENGDAEQSIPTPPISTPQSWHAQLEEAAKEAGAHHAQELVAAESPSSSLSQIGSTPSSARRSPRHVQDQAESIVAGDLHRQHLEIVAIGADVKPKKRSSPRSPNLTPPKKKMLKLSTTGKLLSSPKQLSPLSKLVSRPASSVRLQRGKLTSSLRVILKYGIVGASRSRIGSQINDILQGSRIMRPDDKAEADVPAKTTHPFFMGKLRPQKSSNISMAPSEVSTQGQDTERDGSETSQTTKPPDWKDLVFAAKKTLHPKVLDALDPLWPPSELQRLGRDTADMPPLIPPHHQTQKSKLKEHDLMVDNTEDILQSFRSELFQRASSADTHLKPPERVIMSGRQMLAMLGDGSTDVALNSLPETSITHDTLAAIRASLVTHLSPFDLGRLDVCQDWAMKYAPNKAMDVLQPGCTSLRDWLSNLSVHHAKARTDAVKRTGHSEDQSRKKRRRKKLDDLDDFIASSDDEDLQASHTVKNAILLQGPSGCGKTASVFAVANELNFEVFEIHPGMRRSAKDIFDKVGDMTQNHLVQQATNLDSKPKPNGAVLTSEDDHPGPKLAGHVAMDRLFGTKIKKEAKGKSHQDKAASLVAKPAKAQKESLVLFEEVDILFEEDKSFWTGVIALIEQSKRPVILTCNDSREIPFQDLPLHTVLQFEPPRLEIAVEYLLSIAAKEGHLLERDAVSALYDSKGRDIRAALTELDFWCQMTLGSQQGGLDWMLDRRQPGSDINDVGEKLRVFSKGTFTTGLDMYPQRRPSNGSKQHEDSLAYFRDEFHIPVLHWHNDQLSFPQGPDMHDIPPNTSARVNLLREMEDLADSRSVLDVTDNYLAPSFSVVITNAFFPETVPPGKVEIVEALRYIRHTGEVGREGLIAAFEPVTVEKPSFPPSVGRLAPSLEGPTSIIAMDIAPYIRSIVSFDQRLERQRDELAGGSQGKKTRTTRAARAALEGGSKASTRRERWFPDATNFKDVLKTGGDWPLWHAESETISRESTLTSPNSVLIITDDEVVSNAL